MLNKIALSISLLLLVHTATADVAIYRDGTLTVPTGAVVNADNSIDFYRDIVFTTNADGTIALVSADVRATTNVSVDGEAGYLENSQLHIPQGAVVLADGEAQYYGNIVLTLNSNDTLSVLAAEARSAVEITDVSIQNFTGFPSNIFVNVSGNKSRACVDLEEVGFHRQTEQMGRVFTIIVAESELDASVSCAPSPTAFSITVQLPVCTCTPGDYTAVVNGTHRAFFTLVE